MIVLAETDPALRASWLLVCDRAERKLPKLLEIRLGLDPGSREARTLAASVFGAVRAVNDELSIAVAADPTALDPIDAAEVFSHAIRIGSGGRLGDPVSPATPVTRRIIMTTDALAGPRTSRPRLMEVAAAAVVYLFFYYAVAPAVARMSQRMRSSRVSLSPRCQA